MDKSALIGFEGLKQSLRKRRREFRMLQQILKSTIMNSVFHQNVFPRTRINMRFCHHCHHDHHCDHHDHHCMASREQESFLEAWETLNVGMLFDFLYIVIFVSVSGPCETPHVSHNAINLLTQCLEQIASLFPDPR